ncbi:MAG: LytTR family DNA-binding domain-containing protein [Beduini sp.]|uniref:LytTR family DNA-binding domain-containing protein n=1 Tax=Beduini sp. TaxID=1922300 RepID=UPI0039A1203B
MQIKIIEDDRAEDIQITIRCPKQDEKLKALLALLQIQDHKCIGKYRGEDHLIPLEDIYYIDTLDKQVYLYTETITYESDLRLYEIEERFIDLDFLRIGKSTIINFQKIKSLRPDLGGRIQVTMKNGIKLFVSRQYAPSLKKRLGVLK